MVDLARPEPTEIAVPIGTPKEMDVIRRAYQLWQQAGEPAGKDDEFYHQAKNELQQALDKNTENGTSFGN